MCNCNPEIKAPFCGKPGCEWPQQVEKDEIVEGTGCAMHDLGSCGIAKNLQDIVDELQRVFDLRWQADQRAIKMWRAAHPGKDMVWPDHADLVVWLLERLTHEPDDKDAALESFRATFIDNTGGPNEKIMEMRRRYEEVEAEKSAQGSTCKTSI